MEFWISVFIALGTVASMLLHHSHNKKLNAIGDVVDKLDGAAK